MPKKTTIQDPLFGKLTFDWLWEGAVDVEPFGKIKVNVDGGNQGLPPTKAQQDSFALVRGLLPEFKSEIDRAIFAYYQDNREKFLTLAVDPDEEVPIITQIDDLHRILISPPILTVGVQANRKVPMKCFIHSETVRSVG